MKIMRRNLKMFSILLFITGVMSVFYPGVSFSQIDNIGKFLIEEQILLHVRESFVDTVSSETLLDGAIQGMIDKLDPHSSYLPPDEAKDFSEKIQGEFSGIGITFSIVNGKITVIEIIEGGPSEKAGLKCRDKIVKINGESSVSIPDDSVKSKLRGPKGSTVMVSVERPGESSLRDIRITRDDIDLNSVSHSYMLDSVTGYIALSRFSIKSAVDVSKALDELRKKGMKRIVLDLRNNSGGSLDAAVGVVDCFIKKGPIVETRGKNKSENRKWAASGRGAYNNYPMIVMINHGSASASEIVAGGLQDHDRALIIGQTSFGKGLVMNKIPLRDKSGKNEKYLGDLILSVAHYYTPSGRLIQRPYDKGKVKYLKDAFDEVDPNAVDSLKTGRPEFLTDLGRKVYGGGGITPDIYMAPQPRLNNLESALRSGNLMFEFVDGYLLRNRDIPSEFDEFKKNYNMPVAEMEILRNFLIEKKIPLVDSTGFIDELKKVTDKSDLPDNAVDIIKKALASNNISYDTDLFAGSRDFIRKEIKQEIARMIWGPEYRYRVWHETDEELKTAVTYFGEAESLLKKRLAIDK